jgi:hypothetical protein
MFSFFLKQGEDVYAGAVPIKRTTFHNDSIIPFQTKLTTISDSWGNLDFRFQDSSGRDTLLPTIHSGEVFYDMQFPNSTHPGPNLDLFDSSNNEKGIRKADKPLIDSFIGQLGFQDIKTLEILKSKLSSLDPSPDLRYFISYVRNGAFFKHWADHYAEQAKKMASSLGLAS